MGQEQSYAHANIHVRRYKGKYDDPIQYRSSIDYRTSDYDNKEYDYKRHKLRRSADSFKSYNSSTESSGYRSGSSAYETRSDSSSKSGHYCSTFYKNDYYKDINKEVYKPVKISKEKRYKRQFFDIPREDAKSDTLKNYLSETESAKLKVPVPKKAGIRNYTPKILSEEEQRKKLDWN